MSDHIQQTIADLQQKLRRQEQEVAETKRLINLLCREAGNEALYPETDTAAAESVFSLRSDQFYGRPLATVMKEYLNMRRSARLGAATVKEIFEALSRGGYKFEAKNEENAKRGLQVSLSKNQAFHRIPTGAWGLTEWYPSVKPEKLENDKPGERGRSDATSEPNDEDEG